MSTIKLGQTVKDRVTGFIGIATSRVEYLNGCTQFYIKPKQKTGEAAMPEGTYIDIAQLVVVDDGILETVATVEDASGGDMADTPSV